MFPTNLKTGFSPVVEQTYDLDLNRINNMLQLFSEKSILFGAHYAKCAGRDNLSGMDIIYALQYLTHEFMNLETLEDELNEINNSDNIDDSDDDSDNIDDDDNDNDEFTRVSDTTTDEMCRKMNEYHDTWNEWNPTDIVEQILKRNIDKLIIPE